MFDPFTYSLSADRRPLVTLESIELTTLPWAHIERLTSNCLGWYDRSVHIPIAHRGCRLLLTGESLQPRSIGNAYWFNRAATTSHPGMEAGTIVMIAIYRDINENPRWREDLRPIFQMDARVQLLDPSDEQPRQIVTRVHRGIAYPGRDDKSVVLKGTGARWYDQLLTYIEWFTQSTHLAFMHTEERAFPDHFRTPLLPPRPWSRLFAPILVRHGYTKKSLCCWERRYVP